MSNNAAAEVVIQPGQEVLIYSLRAIGLVSTSIFAYIGVAIGLINVSIGVCQATEIRSKFSTTLYPLLFGAAPVLFALISYFKMRTMDLKTVKEAMHFCAYGVISGVGCWCTGYAVGGITKYSAVTTIQQKRFFVQYVLLLIFTELISLFGFIIALAG